MTPSSKQHTTYMERQMETKRRRIDTQTTTPPLTSTSYSETTAATTKTSSSSTSSLILSSLPQALFPLICSFLTLEDKLLGVLQVCHTVNQWFSPSCFITNTLTRQQLRAVAHRLQQNQSHNIVFSLSLIPSVECDLDDPSLLLSFTRLTKLSFETRPKSTETTETAFRSMIEANPQFFHHITEFTCLCSLPVWEFTEDKVPRLSSIDVTSDTVRRACFLPKMVKILPSLTSLEVREVPFLQSNTLLPLLRHIPWTQLRRLALECIRWTDNEHECLMSLFQTQQSASLQYLRLHGQWCSRLHNSLAAPPFVSLFPLLITLDLSQFCPHKSTVGISGASRSSTPPSIPNLPNLRHLLLPAYPEEYGEFVYQATLSLLRSVASQLTVLHCSLFHEWKFTHHPSLIRQVFTMTTLRKLSLSTKGVLFDDEPHIDQIFASAAQGCSFPHLHTLALSGISMKTQSIEALLMGTPLLADFTSSGSFLGAQIIPLLGVHCPLIRSIRIAARDSRVCKPPVTGCDGWDLTGCLTAEHQEKLQHCRFTPFSHLQIFQLLPCSVVSPAMTYSRTALPILLQMLNPSRLMCVTLRWHYLTCDQLILFARFHSLRMFDVNVDTFSHCCCDECNVLLGHKYFTRYQPNGGRQSVTDELSPLSQLDGQPHYHFSFPPLFRQSVIPGHESADRQGREAFFYDLKQHIEQGCARDRNRHLVVY